MSNYPFAYAEGFEDADPNWSTIAIKYGKVLLIRLNCKCNRDITGGATVIYLQGGSVYHNIFEGTQLGTFILQDGIIMFSSIGTIKAGEWIRGCIVTLLSN